MRDFSSATKRLLASAFDAVSCSKAASRLGNLLVITEKDQIDLIIPLSIDASEADEAACYRFLARGEFAVALGCRLFQALR